MSKPSFRNWQAVQEEVLRRIHAREWHPGELIPNEIDLAAEFGCARTTVNRALRALADAGILDRRRKAGTRVAIQPVAKATLDISVIRQEVEARGQKYGYQLIDRRMAVPPPGISASMRLIVDTPALHLSSLHLADNRPFVFEDRWINTGVVESAKRESFETQSANEWLLREAPYTHGDIAFSAAAANAIEATLLDCREGAALFVIERLTWDKESSVTQVRLAYGPGYRMRTDL